MGFCKTWFLILKQTWHVELLFLGLKKWKSIIIHELKKNVSICCQNWTKIYLVETGLANALATRMKRKWEGVLPCLSHLGILKDFHGDLVKSMTFVVKIVWVMMRLVRFESIQPVVKLNRKGELEIKKNRTYIADSWNESSSSLDHPSPPIW